MSRRSAATIPIHLSDEELNKVLMDQLAGYGPLIEAEAKMLCDS